jgi:Schlafen, AlbA_2
VTTSNRRRTVEYLDLEGPWLFAGRKRFFNDSGHLVIFLDDLERCTATDLQAALRRSHAAWQEDVPDAVYISSVPESYYNDEIEQFENVSFHLDNGALAMTVEFYLSPGGGRDMQQAVRSALEPLMRRNRMSIVRSDTDTDSAGNTFATDLPVSPTEVLGDSDVDTASDWDVPDIVRVWIAFNARGRNLREIFDVGVDALALISAMDDVELTRVTAGDLIRGGQAHVLIGQPEGHWLDVKCQHYDLKTTGGKIKLAQSVACFCNSEEGGLVVVGMSAKKVPGGEEIRGLHPVPRDKAMVQRYKKALEAHLHPTPDNFRIESVDVRDDGMLILIDVPPQPEERKPFLVHGAVVDGEVRELFISIVRRRDESSISTTAREIHSTLAAGRALLRRGELPRDS